jgi:hypothetical protein
MADRLSGGQQRLSCSKDRHVLSPLASLRQLRGLQVRMLRVARAFSLYKEGSLMTTTTSVYVGVDVSKDILDVAVLGHVADHLERNDT